MEKALHIKKKRRRERIMKIVNNLIKSKPKFYTWSSAELLEQINKRLGGQYKIQNIQILMFLLRFNKTYTVFKHNKVDQTQLIFIENK